jgi:Ser/Thr protein kinase RdoA (MazF antagonist)
MSVRPTLDADELAAVTAAYPALGAFTGLVRNGLSVNAPAALFDTSTGTYFAKRYPPGAGSVADEHRLVRHLVAKGYPTPRLHLTADGASIARHRDASYAVFDLAVGEDRYGDAPVFAPFGSSAEASAAGAALAGFHVAVADMPPPAPRPFEGLVVRLNVLAAPTVEAGLSVLWREAPALFPLLDGRPEWAALRPRLERLRAGLAPRLAGCPVGVIHGDFIKRNLLWEGPRVASVLDFDLWNVAPWVLDLAIALLPTGFDWPRLLAGATDLDGAAMRAMLAGYETVRPLSPAERDALPWVMEAARFEFYLSAALTAHHRGQADQVENFWRLATGVIAWFADHPDWRDALLP